MEASKYNYGKELGAGLPLFRDMEGNQNLGFHAPQYNDLATTEDLRNGEKVFSELSKIDWSFTNENTGFLTHNLHPYPAKYIPQIPGHIISRLSKRGELILDPFGGSGTTALEAVRLGRRVISIDANPISELIGKVKTCNLDKESLSDLQSLRCAISSHADNLPEHPGAYCNKYEEYIPDIPNIDKWFPLTSRGELGLIKSRIKNITATNAKNISELAMSRIILDASYQDSETRYASKPKDIPKGYVLNKYLISLDEVIRSVRRTQSEIRYGVSKFVTADIRNLPEDAVQNSSIDLIITSPPYGNAMDYHLYHRFRLMWLGYDPLELSRIEIGSHLRHQREDTGFNSYLHELKQSLTAMYNSLKPGRYAVLVIGDAKYDGEIYDISKHCGQIASEVGFKNLGSIERNLHKTKRSFVSAGRRAKTESLLIIKKPEKTIQLSLEPPNYQMWHYEKIIRKQEIETLLNLDKFKNVRLDPYSINSIKRLVFTHDISYDNNFREKTWQAILENGFVEDPSKRKDPKYVTHGIHSYKGKFYPQLAKGLMNIVGLKTGSVILDPFCGSGTSLLESYLNGYKGYGIDMHPLAAMISRVKTGILDVNPNVLQETTGALLGKIEQLSGKYEQSKSEFDKECIEEIERWFPEPVIYKLNWIIKVIEDMSDGILQNFFKVILSDIIRQVSHQKPSDLRIRKRDRLLNDAPVFELFTKKLIEQFDRIEQFWSIRGYSPHEFLPAKSLEGDSRNKDSYQNLGLQSGDVDLILTSPPYATALPYIDTDRLTLLTIFGINSSTRRDIEYDLIGSREILKSEKDHFEEMLSSKTMKLPKSTLDFIRDLYAKMSASDVGFRRKNKPALILRFALDMKKVLVNCHRLLKKEGEAIIIIGDNKTSLKGKTIRIPTTDIVNDIANNNGFKTTDTIDISVTTDNMVHKKNAIKENVVLRLQRL